MTSPAPSPMAALLSGASIEVMPRTLAAIPDLRALLAPGTRVYVANIEGTPFSDMLAATRRLRAEGFEPMPHFPARLIADRAALRAQISAYRGEADVREALLLAGGVKKPVGQFDNSMQLLNSGAFDDFARLHVAGHPEGNRDIDPSGGQKRLLEALFTKQDFAQQSGIPMAIVTQFAFEAAPVIDWARNLRTEGITLPVHLGVAGPAKLQTLLKFAIACGVGASLRTLQKRARDVTKLMAPFTPADLLAAVAAHRASHPDSLIEAVHFFPLGGIKASAEWLAAQKKG
ncbi:methylenetetrahydrofolate reductase [Phaeovulum vinaykumarii]|nr:5,10-methylenetetrahydrofolate reductase [Phaeovulum vinaykumarii]